MAAIVGDNRVSTLALRVMKAIIKLAMTKRIMIKAVVVVVMIMMMIIASVATTTIMM